MSGAPGAFNSIENSVEFRNNKRSGTPASVPMSFSCAASRMSRLPPFAVCHQRTSGRARAISCLTRARCRSRSGFLRKLLHSKQFGRGRFAGLMQQFTNCDVQEVPIFPRIAQLETRGCEQPNRVANFVGPPRTSIISWMELICSLIYASIITEQNLSQPSCGERQ